MEITKNVKKKVVEVVDIKCDICKKSCKDKVTGNLEFMKLSVNWGFGSKYDLESWEAHICEKCVDTKLVPIINFNKKKEL